MNEVELILLFKKHRKDFVVMLENDVFDFKHGHMQIHRDKYGELKQIKRILTSYQAEK